MRLFAILGACLLVCVAVGTPQSKSPVKGKQEKAAAPAVKLPPETILFANTYGESTFTHKKHFDRVGGDCSVCHTAIFPQSREDINYKKALHRAAEASKKSCATCHRVGGTSFAADSNCIKCHASKYKRAAAIPVVPAPREFVPAPNPSALR